MNSIFEFVLDLIWHFFVPRNFRNENSGKGYFGDIATDLRWIAYIILVAVLFSSQAFGFLSFLLAGIIADLILEFVPGIQDTFLYKLLQSIFLFLATIGIIFIVLYIVSSMKADIQGL